MIIGPWENQLWASNLDGQKHDDFTFEGGTSEAEIYLRFTITGLETGYDENVVALYLTPSGTDDYEVGTVLDPFNRADNPIDVGQPLWEVIGTNPMPSIVSNRVTVPTGTVAAAYWNDLFDADQEASLLFDVGDATYDVTFLIARAADPSANPLDSYALLMSVALDVWQLTADGSTPLDEGTLPFTPQGLKLVCEGDQISAYLWDGADWQELTTVTDSTWTADGYILWLAGSISTGELYIDDWDGGILVPDVWEDADTVSLLFTPSGIEEGYDQATVPLVFTPLSDEYITHEYIDTGTAVCLFTPSGSEEHTTYDAATALVLFTPSGEDVIEHPCFSGEGVADINWTASSDYRWDSEADVRWMAVMHIGAGVC